MFVSLPRSSRRLAGAAAAACLAAIGASGPAATQTVPTRVEADASEVQQFCTGIADAARDRRYALQAAELKKLQSDVDERIKLLEQKRADYEDWMKRREQFIQQAQESVVHIYVAMKPDAAADRLAVVNAPLAAAILMKMDARKAGVILNEMDSKAAATLTTIMSAAARREDPS